MVTPKIGGRKIGDFQERWQPKNILESGNTSKLLWKPQPTNFKIAEILRKHFRRLLDKTRANEQASGCAFRTRLCKRHSHGD